MPPENLVRLVIKGLPVWGILLMQVCNFGRWNTRLRFLSAVAHNERTGESQIYRGGVAGTGVAAENGPNEDVIVF